MFLQAGSAAAATDSTEPGACDREPPWRVAVPSACEAWRTGPGRREHGAGAGTVGAARAVVDAGLGHPRHRPAPAEMRRPRRPPGVVYGGGTLGRYFARGTAPWGAGPGPSGPLRVAVRTWAGRPRGRRWAGGSGFLNLVRVFDSPRGYQRRKARRIAAAGPECDTWCDTSRERYATPGPGRASVHLPAPPATTRPDRCGRTEALTAPAAARLARPGTLPGWPAGRRSEGPPPRRLPPAPPPPSPGRGDGPRSPPTTTETPSPPASPSTVGRVIRAPRPRPHHRSSWRPAARPAGGARPGGPLDPGAAGRAGPPRPVRRPGAGPHLSLA
jgi:hypothetical protein